MSDFESKMVAVNDVLNTYFDAEKAGLHERIALVGVVLDSWKQQQRNYEHSHYMQKTLGLDLDKLKELVPPEMTDNENSSG